MFKFPKPLLTSHAYCVCEVYRGWFYDGFSENLAKLQEINRTRDRRFHIVTPQWIAESIEAEKLLKEREFPLRIQLWHSEYWCNTYNIQVWQISGITLHIEWNAFLTSTMSLGDSIRHQQKWEVFVRLILVEKWQSCFFVHFWRHFLIFSYYRWSDTSSDSRCFAKCCFVTWITMMMHIPVINLIDIWLTPSYLIIRIYSPQPFLNLFVFHFLSCDRIVMRSCATFYILLFLAISRVMQKERTDS